MHGQKKVLIIDDEIDLCLLLKSYFLRKGHEVHLSHSLEEGVSLVEDLKPDIIFLDNNLPDGIGWQVAPELAAAFPNIHIVLISAFHPDMPEMPVNAKVQMIEKPISLTDLDRQFAEIMLQRVK